jgi:hypothetical protein
MNSRRESCSISAIYIMYTLHLTHHSANVTHIQQWKSAGEKIARRNLIVSIPNHLCCFGVWLVWSGKREKAVYIYNFFWESIPTTSSIFLLFLFSFQIYTAIAAKIVQMHDQDSSVYPFQDWGSPQGTEVCFCLV